MGFDIASLGMQAAGNIVDAGLGLALQRGQDKRTLNMNRKQQRMQMEGTKEMTDYNMKKQLEMWHATSYGAQMEELRKAGLNPGLIYGMGGAGGQTANVQTGGTSAGTAPVGGGEVQAMMELGLQRQLQQAQIKNIEADTKKKEVEATKTAGVDTELGKTQIASLTQGIENAKAQEELTKIEAEIKAVENEIAGKTQNAQIAMVLTNIRSATAAMDILERQNDIDAQTKDEKIGQIEAQYAGELLRNILTSAQTTATKAGTAKTMEEINAIVNQVHIAWETLRNEQDKTAIEKKLQEFETSFGKQAAGALGTVLEALPIKTRKRR